jgi:hypothetical protein
MESDLSFLSVSFGRKETLQGPPIDGFSFVKFKNYEAFV